MSMTKIAVTLIAVTIDNGCPYEVNDTTRNALQTLGLA